VKAQGGFTLIEVMVSIVLCSIAVIGVIALHRVTANASGFSRRSAEAAALAQDKLESLRTITPVAGTVTETGLDEQGKSGGPFTRTTKQTIGTDYIDITVQVLWDDESTATTGTQQLLSVSGRRGL
jgi:type II secretory pathway pseudopilin PulG